MAPEVSIIIPVYNVERYLGLCLDSVLNQTFGDLEVICVDDGSTDGSSAILTSYAKKDRRLKCFRQENQGAACARNYALTQAQGRYISFVDSDDYLNLDTLDKTLACFRKNIDYVCFGANLFGDAFLECRKGESDYCNPSYRGRVKINAEVIQTTNVHLWNKIFRRELIESARIVFPAGLYYQDFVFTWKYMMMSRRAYYLADHLYNYRKREDSVMGRTMAKATEKVTDHLHCVFDLFAFMRLNGLMGRYQSLYVDTFIRYFYFAYNYSIDEHKADTIKLASQLLKEMFKAEPILTDNRLIKDLLSEDYGQVEAFLAANKPPKSRLGFRRRNVRRLGRLVQHFFPGRRQR